MKRIPLILGAAAIALLLWAVRRDLNEPHVRLFSDMVRSPAYHSQQTNPVFRNGRTLQRPVEGTIPRGFTPFEFGPGEEERKRAGQELKNPFEPSYEVVTRGKVVFDNFCAHCHGSKGLGNGPVTKAFPAFSFPIASKATYDLPDGTLFHIITYGRNLMPAHASQVSQSDRWKVIYYLRDLQRKEMARLGPLAIIPEDPRRHNLVSAAYGKELFASNCAACHGAEGAHPQPAIPTLHSPSVLAIANDEYYWDIINHGRRGTQMPAWKDVLTKTQILSIVQYIRSWASPTPDRGKTLTLAGDASRGEAVFKTRCSGCHGVNGQGGIGNSLNAPSFLALASDQFLRDTITLGRMHTAMPASYDLSTQDVSDLITFIRGWSKPVANYAEVAAILPKASAKNGTEIFRDRCAGCHGDAGEGGIGSRLNSDSFLRMVDNRFLYRVIAEGRSGTEMPAWRFLPASDVADLIAFIRDWQKSPSVTLSTASHQGRPEFGEVLFKQECAKCHGSGGSGELGTQIGNPAFLSQVADDFLFRTIADGKPETEMKGFRRRARNPLGDEDINHLIAYLRQLEKEPPIEPLRRRYTWASAKDGRKVFENKGGCAKCHGEHGEGASGPSLGLPGFLQVASDGFLAGTIILGRENTPMKSYHSGPVRLEEEDIENVVAYIRSFEKAQGKDTRTVDRSAEAVEGGRALFARNCSKCHGDRGEGRKDAKTGRFAPSLNTQEFLNAADDNFLLATLALGRPGTAMPSFGTGGSGVSALTAEEMRKIVAFIRTWEKKK